MPLHDSSTLRELIVTSEPAGLTSDIVSEALKEAVASRGRCLVTLSGGRTPLALYRLLANRSELPWSRVELFWGDERFVPTDHPDSNAGAAQGVLIEKISVPEPQVHRWPILASAEESARDYAETLKRVAGDPPRFDITLLGLGADCHTASLFPGSSSLLAEGLTVATRAPANGQERLSLTAGALSGSRLVIFLVTGDEKRSALDELMSQEGDPERCPARAIGALERLLIITDLE